MTDADREHLDARLADARARRYAWRVFERASRRAAMRLITRTPADDLNDTESTASK